MKIIHTAGIPSKYSNDIKELLRLCDKEFVPPLSARDNTSQTDFSIENKTSTEPVTYYNSLCTQENFLIIDEHQAIGIMSYVRDYINDVTVGNQPNIYISTLIVHPSHRHRGLANKLYAKMLKTHGNRYIFTRTWSTNNGHIRILSALKFYEFMRIDNDRGRGIDTIYYRREPDKVRLSLLLKQYRLGSSVIFFGILLFLIILFLIVWFNSKSDIANELSIAFATSLLASAFCLLSDTFIKFREAKNDEYITKLKSFGIANLQFHKDQLLEQLLPRCKREIWISGYRLIMTGKKKFLEAIRLACLHGKNISIRLMAVPPWSDTYRSVYGNDDVKSNYYNVFKHLALCVREYGASVEIRFTEVPIFNDTYKVDDRFVTGPYLHCPGKEGGKITAKDFFSFDIDDPKKELYDIIHQDYTAVWEKCRLSIDLEAFYQIAENLDSESFFEKYSLQDFLKKIS